MTDLPTSDRAATSPLVLITGPSGAGRGTVIRAFEDMGYEAIDNLSLSLLPHLLSAPAGLDAAPERPIALGVDPRNRDFTVEALIDAADRLGALSGRRVQLIFVDCSPDVLLRRFSKTRRRHPLAPDESAEIDIARELDLLRAVRRRADILIDTSELGPRQLRRGVEDWIVPWGAGRMAASIQSFSYKCGLPRATDTVVDCRFPRNPYSEPYLRECDGRAPEVAACVAAVSRFAVFHAQLT